MHLRIAIVGAGVGGLSAALACQRCGLDVQLFDMAEHPLSGGAALTLWPNALLALRRLDLFDRPPDWLHFLRQGDLRSDKNAVLYRLPLSWMASTYGYAPTCMERSRLLTWLYTALGQPVIHRAACTAVTVQGRGVRVYFGDGSSEVFDGVIAADGIHSSVRLGLAGEARKTAPYTAWRGIARGAQVPPASMREYTGRGTRFGYAAMNPASTYWFATVNHRLMGHDKAGGWEAVVDRFALFPDLVKRCIAATRPDEILQNPVQELAPGTPLAFGNVALLGDAAHALTPNLGFGACLALEDAAVLADCLAGGDSLQAVFRRYAALRRTRVAWMARFARWLGQTTQWEHGALTAARNVAFRSVPERMTRLVWKTLLGDASASRHRC